MSDLLERASWTDEQLREQIRNYRRILATPDRVCGAEQRRAYVRRLLREAREELARR